MRLQLRRWQRVYPRVYRLRGSPKTWRQAAMAACLYTGNRGVLSHRAAALLGGFATFKRARVEITVPRNRNRSVATKVKVHWTHEPIPRQDITVIDGIRVTRPARTLLDLAATEPEALVGQCLDEAIRRRLVSLAFLDRWLAEPRRRHRGIPVLRRLVEDRATVGVTESPLEADLLTLLRRAGLPIPMLQYRVEHDGRFIGRLDFAYPKEKVGLEADGFRYHDGRETLDTERARGNELQALGWLILRITSKHIQQDPEGVVDWIRRSLESRR